jgi:signal transduction histidine kinase
MEIALRSPRSEAEYIEVMKSGLEEIERISLLVEGLLLLARSDAGVLKMDCKPVDLLMVTEEVIDRLASLARSQQISLTLGHIESLEVPGDIVHLKRLLFNLVDNAIKYTPRGGNVTVSVEKVEAFAVLSVADTGIGVLEEDNQKVFQRFFRSAEARSGTQGGSGLGLSIVKSIAEGHGGKVELTSMPGQGSTFRVYLPLISAK